MNVIERAFISDIKLLRENVPSFEEFPFSLRALSKLQSLKLHPQVTFFVGENGTGKSTFIEAIAVAFGLNPEGGGRNFSFATRRSHSALWQHLRLVKGIKKPADSFFLRAESFFNLATEIERLDSEPWGGRKIGRSSIPTAANRCTSNLMGSRFSPCSASAFAEILYILDEPEAALSPARQLSMLALLHDLVRQRSQFIIATHSPLLTTYPHATIYELDDAGFTEVRNKDARHFRTYKSFLLKPEKMLRILLHEAEDGSEE